MSDEKVKLKCPSKTNEAGHGSKTMTITQFENQKEPEKINITARDKNDSEKESNRRKVTWTEETVDNEHMGKKSSKGTKKSFEKFRVIFLNVTKITKF